MGVGTRRGAAWRKRAAHYDAFDLTANHAAPCGSAIARGGARADTMNRVRLRPCSAAQPRSTCHAVYQLQLTTYERAFTRVAFYRAAVLDRNTVLAGPRSGKDSNNEFIALALESTHEIVKGFVSESAS
jgi:hypothetical protein